MEDRYISISCLPLPTFIQGGYAIFGAGETHPNRNDLQYFVLMFIVKGRLFIAEDGENYTLAANDMFILLPRHHHYSWKPAESQTEYYWIHFYITGKWVQEKRPVQVGSEIDIPTLHYFTPTMTMYLAKKRHFTNQEDLFSLINRIFKNSALQNNVGFWQAQQLFIDLLQMIQSPNLGESSTTRLADQIQRYLRDHFDEKITNETLGKMFHVHPNSITASMKKTFGMTPNHFLQRYRLEEAVKRLLTTREPVSTIALEVGYSNVYYFSNAFKKSYGTSPADYRKKYGNNANQ
ncbi:AraC family transcriptional regulator [Lentilactobacillus fungorum]|uniref:AraC family transcriptional regulator n=1 Tax=Lentilactobacillus fungorum TaxID=2201250 RepID=A0ABQ3W0M0_9LACO|nr:AraC family transcriptional regulator [Lentilactobacillus fungorum]GHP14011.1 AraC family transcriptional regulator [Lentilactobacillus fungorum]